MIGLGSELVIYFRKSLELHIDTLPPYISPRDSDINIHYSKSSVAIINPADFPLRFDLDQEIRIKLVDQWAVIKGNARRPHLLR